MPGQPPTAPKEVAPSWLLAEVKGKLAQPASVGLSLAVVTLTSARLPATSPVALITQTRNNGESSLRGLDGGWEWCEWHRRPGEGWTKRAVRRCPSPSGCSVAFGHWGRQGKDEDHAWSLCTSWEACALVNESKE